MIGDPVAQARTPAILNAFFRESEVDAHVSARRVSEAAFAATIGEMMADPDLDGLLVTMPHKREIIRFLDRQTKKSRRIGSVNCVKRVPEIGWVGAQFDGVGLTRALLKRKIDIGARDILLVGAGGAGVAIGFELVEHGCRRLDVYDVDQAASKALAERLEAVSPDAAVGHCGRIEGGYSLYINATPVGMQAKDQSPIPLELIEPPAAVVDIVADPNDTCLARGSRERGAAVVTGYEMACGQVQPIAEYLLSPAVKQ